MAINQLNIVFAIGEVSLLFLILVLALIARWAGKRETAREIAALPVYQPKLYGLEAAATSAAAQYAALQIDSAILHAVPQLVQTASAEDQVETVTT